MNTEKKIKESFKRLKEDINEIKKQLSIISQKIGGEINSEHEQVVKGPKKIFTSKVFVNQNMKNAVNNVFNSGMFSMGEKLKKFEKRFAELTGAKYAIALANGTVAIEVALQCLGIKKGDEIIVPSHTTMPTIEPILKLNANPVFVDIDEKTYGINIEKINKVITKKTKAIMPVHLYGHSVDIDPIRRLCKKQGLFLIEDCAQAHNAKYNGKHVGTIGDVGCFSFYPTKNITVCSEGGMIITDNPEINEKARMIINHGEKIGKRYEHIMLGNNYRLGEIQCAIGIEQLKLLDFLTEKRRKIAEKYNKLLKNANLILPSEANFAKHVYHQYVIRVKAENRDKIIQELRKDNIFLGVHYPVPVHMQPIIKKNFKVPKLPVTEKIVKEIISLPIYPELADAEIEMIAEKIKKLV